MRDALQLNGRSNWPRAICTDGTRLSNVRSCRFNGFDTSIWFVGTDDKDREVAVPATAIQRLIATTHTTAFA